MHELFQTESDIAFDEIAAAAWMSGIEAGLQTDDSTPELTKCIGRVCINCDDRYLFS